jgi:hypothetical protein
MKVEIHCAIEQCSSEILAKARAALNVIIATREVAERTVKYYETFVALYHQAAQHSTRGVKQELLVRLCESIQVAMTSGSLPKHVNQAVYASMIAGVSALAQINVVDLQTAVWLYASTSRIICEKHEDIPSGRPILLK